MSVSDDLPPLSAETAELYLPLWVDGVLDAAEAEQMEGYVAADSDLAELAELLSASDGALGGAFEDVLHAPLPIHLARAASMPPSGAAPEVEDVPTPAPEERAAPIPFERPVAKTRAVGVWGWAAIAACLALMAIGGPMLYQQGVTTGAQTAQGPGWIEQVATYHSVYGSEERHLVEVGADERDHIRAWLGNRTGYEGDIPDLTALGLTFAGGRMLVTNDGRPVAQLMYTQADGRPVGLCFVKSAGADAGPSFRQFGEIGVMSWTEGGHGFVVVGWEDQERLAEITGTLL